MRAALLTLCALLFASAALAQRQEPPLAFTPRFSAEPAQADFIRNYPPEALAQNVSGIAVLCCQPRPDRSMTCASRLEWPADQGFGEASVRASSAYRLSEDSYADLAARPGVLVRISMLWAGPVVSDTTIAELRRIDAESMQACLASE